MAFLGKLMDSVQTDIPRGVCPTCDGVAGVTGVVVGPLVESPIQPFVQSPMTSGAWIDFAPGNSTHSAVFVQTEEDRGKAGAKEMAGKELQVVVDMVATSRVEAKVLYMVM